jgi:hypothetical protein
VLTNRVCSVSIDILEAEPYNLAGGSSILVTVVATNMYGDSPRAFSEAGVVLSSPDAPIRLENDNSVTTVSVIKINWSDGVSDGGSQILDYNVAYD